MGVPFCARDILPAKRPARTITTRLPELDVIYVSFRSRNIRTKRSRVSKSGQAGKAKAAKEGTSKLYIDHIRMLCDIVISLGKIPVMWADIALNLFLRNDTLSAPQTKLMWGTGWMKVRGSLIAPFFTM